MDWFWIACGGETGLDGGPSRGKEGIVVRVRWGVDCLWIACGGETGLDGGPSRGKEGDCC